ncbi:MAG: hypothetical protein HOP14_14380 [Acidobacteria bacterium]|nr:hypothetical protein [Acidobacteriota bacterium]
MTRAQGHTDGVTRLATAAVLAGTALLLALHAAGWLGAAVAVARVDVWYVPRAQSAIVLALGLWLLRAAAAPRHVRRAVVLGTLGLCAATFLLAPLPERFAGQVIMPGGVDTAATRATFEARFTAGSVNFHSHLGDVLMLALDRWFGGTLTSAAAAYGLVSRLAGWLFLLELAVAAAWHGWSRQACRYVALAVSLPLSVLFFGYWELGYLAVAAGVVPLLALARRPGRTRCAAGRAAPHVTGTAPGRVSSDATRGGAKGASRDASSDDSVPMLAAGFLQGLHTAFHGFGLLGLAGGTLAAAAGHGAVRQRVVRALTFASAGVALYLGWVFLYITVAGWSVQWTRELGYRPLVAALEFDHRLAVPLLSMNGLAEFGVFSALAGVPLLALAYATAPRARLVPAVLYGLPGLVFLIRWWPVSAPFNLDLLLSVFPGVFAALWALAPSRRVAWMAFAFCVGLHALMWTVVGNAMFNRALLGGL